MWAEDARLLLWMTNIKQLAYGEDRAYMEDPEEMFDEWQGIDQSEFEQQLQDFDPDAFLKANR